MPIIEPFFHVECLITVVLVWFLFVNEVLKVLIKGNSSFFLPLPGFMSVTLKDPEFIKDPNICDIRHME